MIATSNKMVAQIKQQMKAKNRIRRSKQNKCAEVDHKENNVLKQVENILMYFYGEL